MKKSLLILPLVAVSLAGCNPPTDSSDNGQLLDLIVLSGLKDEYVQDTIVDLSKVSVSATYENATITINGNDLTFDPAILDTSELGEFEITISYLTESVVWPYSVVQYDEIDNIGAPEFVTIYQANIAQKSEANKRSEFMDREQGYAVGDDNPFIFFPTIYAYDSNGDEMEVTAYHSSSLIQEKNGAEWVTLSGAELDAVVAIDDFASTYDFTEEAIGHTYRLTVRPHGEEYATQAKFATSFEFTVQDGYNAYTQDDLTHYDNMNVDRWNAYRTEKGITQVALNGLFLHNDIKIERENIPDGFFYMEGDADVFPTDSDIDRVYGSLRDGVDIYHRDILPGESFVFNGNYFNIDYSSLPVVVRESGRIDAEAGLVISHATFIKAGNRQTGEDLGDYTMKNLSIVGNANRTEEKVKSGGAIFTKLLSVDSHIYNMIITQCFTAILTELDGPNAIIEKTRGYDSFSSMLYNWGTDNLLIKDSEFIGAGGPIIITDHVSPGVGGAGGNPPHTKVENSVMESFVTGGENWFRLVHADTAVPGILGIGQGVLPAYGTNTIIKMININGTNIPHFSLVAVVKDGAAASPTSTVINGTFQIDDGVALDFAGPFMSGVDVFPHAMPRFQSTGGQVALFDGQKLVDATNTPIMPYQYTNTNYFTGDYMNLYYNIGSGDGFMGLVFGLVDSAT